MVLYFAYNSIKSAIETIPHLPVVFASGILNGMIYSSATEETALDGGVL